MSSPDKRPFDLTSPLRGLNLTAMPLTFAAPMVAPSSGVVTAEFSDITGRCAPASVGQFGPGAMPRLRDERVVYTVPCQAGFRGAVLALAKKRGVDAAELVRMVLTLVSPAVRAAIPDPGVPGPEDRDSHGRLHGPIRRTQTLVPTLVLRLDPDLDHATIRQALAVALALDDPKSHRLVREDEHARLATSVERLEYRNRALANAVERLSFRPRPGRLGLRDAALMLGFATEHDFDEQLVTKRFRELAPIFHPDTGILPCRERMAQLIDARNLLIKHLRAIPAAAGEAAKKPRER